ncbi:PIG-L family deacetylase [Streptomyces sannanensis]|uniref:PIG-L family deacetylase n=1 Tax=Streptomyces sannanensis TaxID=285536 RepID=A0ABP6SLP9_9ACTN
MTLFGRNVLVITAHPDDAELAVGGTVAALTAQGTAVTVAILTVSETASAAAPDRRSHRIAAAEAAATLLGHRIEWIAGGRYDQVEDLPEYRVVELVDELIDRVGPDSVITHWDGDSHGDHVRVARAAIASSRRWPQTAFLQFGPNEPRTVRHAQFVPNVYIPIGAHAQVKARALACFRYPSQGFRALDTGAVETFDRARGAAVGTEAAEGLLLVRHRVSLDGPPTAPNPDASHSESD